LMRGIRQPFTFSTVMELRTNFRATDAPFRPLEFSQLPVMSRQVVRGKKAIVSCSLRTGYSKWKMLPAHSSRRTNCTLPSLATLAFRPRNFLTASSATFASFPNANRLTTMFALWEWKCSTPVELLLSLASAAAERLSGCWRERQLHRVGAVTTQNVLLVTGEND